MIYLIGLFPLIELLLIAFVMFKMFKVSKYLINKAERYSFQTALAVAGIVDVVVSLLYLVVFTISSIMRVVSLIQQHVAVYNFPNVPFAYDFLLTVLVAVSIWMAIEYSKEQKKLTNVTSAGELYITNIKSSTFELTGLIMIQVALIAHFTVAGL